MSLRWCSSVLCMTMSVSGAHALAPIVTASFCNTSLVLQFQKPLFKFKFSNSSSLALTHRKLVPAALIQPSSSRDDFDFDFDFVVVNFYHFVFIQDPQAEVVKHRSFLELEYSGPSKDALAYVNWLREDNRFSDILVQISPSENGHAFPTLKLRYKPSLVQFEGGISHLSLLDPSMRAIPLSPSEWRDRLEAINKTDLTAKDYPDRNYILLDVRNGYEWDIGHFHGAQRPSVDCFRNTSFGLSQEEIFASDPLSNVDKEKANILMYCTGGIRCDVYSTILRQQGFENLYTLKGGVSHYLKNEGPAEWVGNLFVFDSRLSLPPSIYYTGATTEAESTSISGHDKFAKCYMLHKMCKGSKRLLLFDLHYCSSA
ncbi:Rhodanese-like domain-containing protein 8, chloroplastic, partial [Mucuna pruriens]